MKHLVKMMAQMIGVPSSGEESEPSLPDVDDDVNVGEEVELPDGGSCCNAGCVMALAESVMAMKGQKELKMCLSMIQDKYEADRVKYDCMRHWQTDEHGWRRFIAWGLPLCSKALEDVLDISHAKLTKFCKHLKEGNREPPADLRKTKQQEADPKIMNCHLLLGWLYDNVAEVLAESSDVKAKKFNIAAPSGPTLSQSSPASQRQGVRFLAPGTTILDMFELSSTFQMQELVQGLLPGYKTFCRVYHESWQGILKVRSEGQHGTLVWV